MNIIKNLTDYIDAINEGLIKTHDGQRAINELISRLNRLNIAVYGTFDGYHVILIIRNFNTIQKSNIDNLFDIISVSMVNRFGWFPANMTLANLDGNKISKRYDEGELKFKHSFISEFEIQFDAKFDKLESNITDTLFHLSIQEYETKILKKGLYPKSKNKLSSHLDRVYLCKYINDCYGLIPDMKLQYEDEKNYNLYTIGNKKYVKNTKWVIYEIDNSDKNITLYNDPRYIDGYYTLNNIKPILIKINSKEK